MHSTTSSREYCTRARVDGEFSGGSSRNTQPWGTLNRFQEEYGSVSMDELSDEQRETAKQYFFWTSVAVVAGYAIVFVI